MPPVEPCSVSLSEISLLIPTLDSRSKVMIQEGRSACEWLLFLIGRLLKTYRGQYITRVATTCSHYTVRCELSWVVYTSDNILPRFSIITGGVIVAGRWGGGLAQSGPAAGTQLETKLGLHRTSGPKEGWVGDRR